MNSRSCQRGIGRQEEQFGAGCANGLTDGLALVAAEIVMKTMSPGGRDISARNHQIATETR
jgi:hypothetical protein